MATATEQRARSRKRTRTKDRATVDGLKSSYELSRPQEILVYLLPSLAALGGQLEGIGQIFAFRLAVIVYLFLTVIHLRRRSIRSAALPRYVLVMSWVWVVMALFLSVVHGLPSSGWTEAASVGFGLILVNCVLLGPLTTSTLRAWLRGWTFAVVIEIAIGLWENFTGRHMANYFLYNLAVPEWVVGDKVAGSLGNPNAYAFFLVASVPLLGVSWCLARATKLRFVYPVLMLFIVGLLNDTGSRLSWIVLGLILTMWLFTRNLGLRLIACFIVVISAVVAMMEPAQVSAFLGLDGSSPAATLSGDASTQVRWNLIRNGLVFVNETAFLGLGPGGYEVRMRSGAPFDTGGIQSTHSGAIEIVAQYGLLVFALVVILLVWLMVVATKGMRGSQRGDLLREISVALAIGAVAITPLSFTNSSTLDLSFTWVFLLILCLLGVEVNHRLRPITEEPVVLDTDGRRPDLPKT